MHITKLILHKSKRLHLLKDDTFTLIPEKRHIVIRGVSGLGKSTIMNELSPIPAHMSDFHPGGYKEIHINHNQKDYILISTGKGSGKHQFIVNGDDLNDGGTRAVQLQLVEEHFRYTPKIHAIMLGLERFTRMSGADRRNWFAEMTDTDSDFTNDLWDNIRSGHRDAVGALKDNQSKMVGYSSTLANWESIEDAKRLLSAFESDRELANKLIGKLQLDTVKYDDLKDDINEVNQRMSEIDSLAMSNHKVFFNNACSFVDSYDNNRNEIRALEQLISMRNNEISSIQDDISKKQSQLNQLNSGDGANYDNIDNLLHQLNRRKENLFNEVPEEQLRQDLLQLLSTYPAQFVKTKLFEISDIDIRIGHQLDECIYIAKEAPDNLPTLRSKWLSLTEELNELNNRIRIVEQSRTSIIEHIETFRKEPTHECPKCKHRFRATEDRESQLEERKKSLEEQLQRGYSKRQSLQDELSKIKTYNDCYLTISRLLFSDNSSLGDYLSFFKLLSGVSIEERWSYFSENMMKFLNSGVTLQRKAHLLHQYLELYEEEKSIMKLKEKGDVRSSPEYIAILSNINVLETRLADVQKETELQVKKYHKLKEIVDVQLSIHHNHQHIGMLIGDVLDYIMMKDKQLMSETMNRFLMIVNKEIDDLNKYIEHHKGIQYIINHLEKTKLELDKSVDIHQMLMNILNPKDGLIAKSMIGFVRSFVREMNMYIQHVWTYSLWIDIEDDVEFTKNYTFPVKVGEHKAKDIALTSTGQSEMIDLAFKLVFAKYIGLEDWCVYADELGGTLNSAHRNNLYNLLKRLTEEAGYNQLFVITHLDDIENVMTPGQYIELT